MATPAWPSQPPHPASQRDALAAARKLQQAKRRAEDSPAARPARRPPPATARSNSLRRVKDSREQLRTTRARNTSDAATIESNPGTAPGRSFTVANINNGIIYLRPSVRPAHQRARPLPEPIFPQTPPDSATLDPKARPTSDDWEKSVFEAKTPTRPDFVLPPFPPEVKTDHGIKPLRPEQLHSSPAPHAHHVRSRSFSTIDGHTASSQSFEPGTFKVVIERAGRPRTADTETTPILEVPIPSYRLGTPRFSARGTAILRSSIYTSAAGTEDWRASFLTPQRASHSFLSRPRSDVYSPSSFNFRATMDLRPLQSSEPSSARISKLPIGPQIYDVFTSNPDDQAVVRFASNGDIIAATPSRLIAHITSPSFLDYELLSDFFLTFRSFLLSRELVAYLLSRLRWAVDRQDDFGRIVRVRTFVALRHWILNYFIDDFVPAYRLRVYFCELVNGLYRDLKARQDGGGGDIKIIGELKKCWRRTCALYWETDDRFGQEGIDQDLQPGGQAASLASVDENTFTAALPSTPTRAVAPRHVSERTIPETIGSNPSDQFASKHMDWAHRARHTPQNSLSSPYIPSSQYESGVRVPLSPESERSMQVLSCSIPMRGLNKTEPAKDVTLHAYPVPHPVAAPPSRLTASPQQPSTAKQSNKPSHGHKRSGSFSDALRDNRTHLSYPKSTTSDGDITTVDIATISKIPGSLVRGGLFQPGSPYIDVKNGSLRHTKSRLELAHEDVVHPDVQFRGGYVASPGVKKLLGSVRRALSSKQPGSASSNLAHGYQPNFGSPSARSSNPATISTAASGVQKRRNPRPRPQVRVDVLASAVAESFKEAVQEQINNEQQRRSLLLGPALGGFEFEFERSKTNSNSSQGQIKPAKLEDLRLNSGITAGSKSIVIMDDTGAPPLPVMTGALPVSEKGHEIPVSSPVDLTRVASIDATIEAEKTEMHPEHREVEVPQSWERESRPSVQSSIVPQRRSVSLGRERMHSFRKRGSTKTSMSRPASLRRHTSHASGLGRQKPIESMSTFKTMSSDNDPFHFDRQPSLKALKPARQLRRRPGGDLRAADHVHDLEQGQRPHSTGSVSNRTHSIANSVILRTDRDDESNDKVKVEDASDAESEPTKRKHISLVDTHSSQPNLRPSFEAEVAKLAALPDDIDDDGGIESALMKLEGRYEKKSPDLASSSAKTSPRADVDSGAFEPAAPPAVETYIPTGYKPPQPKTHAKDDELHKPPTPPEAEDQDVDRLSEETFNHRVHHVASQIESEDSYSSVPLLDRDLSEVGSPTRARASTLETMRLSAKPAPLNPLSPGLRGQDQTAASSNSSIEHIIKTESIKRIMADETMPRSPIVRESFFLDDDEDLSDLGSTRRTASNDSHGVRSFFDDETPVGDKDEFLPTHPMRHPPTPPLTANRLVDPLPPVDTTFFEKGLPTPGMSPVSRLNGQPFEVINHPKEAVAPPQEVKQDTKQENSATEPPHFPFILAYDSEILAQQFTIIEKDALDEIDWRELIELRWKQASPQITDWVQYLRTQDARGVDVVIARFNLVVKWAVSEIVLTESIEERAKCIVKFVHIATHARKLRNYATMYQLAIALLSNDVSRMRKTWSLVPAPELHTMRELEALVQPLKNFHNLRVEMETATIEDGCIPFIGIYTRDLIYNAQKPAFIDAPPAAGEKLVNFERHHTAATIVKSLLRLLEASSRYRFSVEPNIISKCLWMAALGDEEITRRSRLCD